MDTFEIYCESKKIDPAKFKAAEQGQFEELSALFMQMSATSFTQQKKFLINALRRRFLLETKEEEKIPKKASAPKPAIPGLKKKPAIKPPQPGTP